MQEEAADKPNVARMYDYFLGGAHNFGIGRRVAEQAVAIYSDLPFVLRANRSFLRRALTFLTEQGIDQFLDLGSGLPVLGAVHEVAQRINPAARVVYVESDPIAARHGETLLQAIHGVAMLQEDIRHTEQILLHATVRRLLDFQRPVGVVLGAVLHLIRDAAEAYGLVREMREAMAPGSYFVISHGTWDHTPPDVAQQVEQLYAGSTNPVTSRSHAQIVRFFAGLDLVPPGVVFLPQWQPENADERFAEQPERAAIYAGVGRKTASAVVVTGDST